jgi:hypothetical protein
MICPKCDFSQPDDYYCAQCGVNVEKYVQKKKKRFNLGLIITVLSMRINQQIQRSPKDHPLQISHRIKM